MPMRLYVKEQDRGRIVPLAGFYPLDRVRLPLWQASLFDWCLLVITLVLLYDAYRDDNWMVIAIACAGYLYGHFSSQS